MSIPSFAGAPLSKGLTVTLTVVSTLAAVTSSQHYFHLPLVPHLTRDHQFYRLLTCQFAFTNSSELFLVVLVLWYSSLAVERMWGTRKFASFLVIISLLSTSFSFLLLLLGYRLTSSRFSSLPAGPFPLVLAIVYQSHRLIPTLYTFRLFYPLLTFTNRFPLYLLTLLLATSQPPSSVFLSLIGLLSSALYTSSPSLSSFRLPTRLYAFLSHTGLRVFGDPKKIKVKRGNAVTQEEAMLLALVGASGGAGGSGGEGAAGMARELAGMRGLRVRSRAASGAAGTGAAEAGEGEGSVGEVEVVFEADEVGEAEPTSPARTAPAPPTATRPSTTETAAPAPPRRSGTSFLRQWQAGLTGAADGPSSEQIAELTGIFPHHSRQAIIAALNESGMSPSRAAEALLASGS
ncbi:hypothetical protein JCM8547_003281 [Rhodosporidiobolus lusitaniae]